ncbi:hypothetical protein [Stappia stellulata]|uniref:hypothetical protein n=1 Tax=Stappia stellulata TaxID=71235 RepID=UPI00041AF596|nr:hypothetical protein [Stappia stellulata]
MVYGRSRSNLLFSEHDGFSIIENQKTQLLSEVSGIPESRFLNTSAEDLVRYLVDRYQLEVPELDVENAVVDQHEAIVGVHGPGYRLARGETCSAPGTQVTLEVPFTGDPQMFKIRPSTFNLSPPRAEIRGQSIILVQSGTQLSGDEVQAGFDRSLKDIGQYLNWQRSDTRSFNDKLPTLARQTIEQRREKLLANQNLLSGLRFKLKERADAPQAYAAPLKRKRINPQLPPASTAPYRPEPVLPEDDYNNILKIIQDMTLVMERSPAAFSRMGEEDIRQHFLVQLNGQYEGKATGETFNAEGKTDILIRHEGRNLFIAECKFWRGEKAHLETINQVLSYLSWRDTKTAVIVFNKNRDFSGVLQKISEATQQHAQFKSGPKIENETCFRYVFGQRDDPNREVILTVLAFDVPHHEKTPTAKPRIRRI